MHTENRLKLTRRAVATCAVASILSAPTLLLAQSFGEVRGNTTGFMMHNWQDHFDELGQGINSSDSISRIMRHWMPSGEMFIYPTSAPMSDHLIRRGYSELTFEDPAPDWTPTPSMTERDPDMPLLLRHKATSKVWRGLFLERPRTEPISANADIWSRERFMVEGAARCGACYTGRNLLSARVIDTEQVKGRGMLPGGCKPPVIEIETRRSGGWDGESLAYSLRTGITPSGDASGNAKEEVVLYGKQILTDAGLEAKATYLMDDHG